MKARAFALVELMVVVAIICALAELVFAVGAPAREAARQRTCVSNLHQIGLAFAQYRADYDGIDPTPGMPILHATLGLPPPPHGGQLAIMPYARSEGIFQCPSYHRTEPTVCTYGLPGILDEEITPEIDLPMIVGQRGMDFPLAVCEQHNADLDFEGQMAWQKKKIVVLRLSQQVEAKWFPSHYINCFGY